MPKIDVLFKKLITQNGSDLHLKQGQKPKLRLHGRLKPLEDQPELTQGALADMLQEIAAPKVWHRFEECGDLDFAYALDTGERFRANYFRHVFGYGAVFRLIPSRIQTLEELEMPKVLKEFSHLRSGLVLITGPTGSGKSTTLAALVDFINTTQAKKIITIEEPVEFLHTNKSSLISHREVGLDTPSFAQGLRFALKSDANLILVGEMRDQETIELALTAAEMGILVFGTLHTNSAPKTIDRIVDVFSTKKKPQIRTILAHTLKGVVSQQLLRSVDGSRRWVAYEILLYTSALASIIMQGETVRLVSEIQMNKARGMLLMDECLTQLVRQGKVTREEAYMKALDKVNFMGGSGTV